MLKLSFKYSIRSQMEECESTRTLLRIYPLTFGQCKFYIARSLQTTSLLEVSADSKCIPSLTFSERVSLTLFSQNPGYFEKIRRTKSCSVSSFLFPACYLPPSLLKFVRSLLSDLQLTCKLIVGLVNYSLLLRFYTYFTDKSTHMYICLYREIVEFGESDKMIKISGKMDEPNNYNNIFRFLLTEELHQIKHFFKVFLHFSKNVDEILWAFFCWGKFYLSWSYCFVYQCPRTLPFYEQFFLIFFFLLLSFSFPFLLDTPLQTMSLMKQETHKPFPSLRFFFFGFVCCVLWHIRICRLFNAKAIFMQIIASI